MLRVPGFAGLLAGQAVNAIGNWVAIIAIWGFAAFEFDAGAGDLAALFVVLSLPGALLGPALGVVVDRIGPRRSLMAANGLGVVAALVLTRADSYGAVIALALPLGLIEALASTSLDALPPRLVPDDQLVRANALLGGAEDLAIVVGPVVAAGVHAVWGLPGAFAADAATFAVGLLVAARLSIEPAPRDDGDEAPSVRRELAAGFRLVRRTPGLRWTLGVVTITYSLWGLAGILEPLYVRDVLARSDTEFALLQAVFGVGLVGAGLTVAAVGERLATPRVVALATVVSGATAALYLGTTSIVVAYVGVFLWGVDVAFFYTPAKTLLQRWAPVSAHGRILSLNQALEPAAQVVATPVAAGLVVWLGVQSLALAAGAVVAVAGLLALRRASRLPPVPTAIVVDATAGSARDAVALGGPAPLPAGGPAPSAPVVVPADDGRGPTSGGGGTGAGPAGRPTGPADPTAAGG